MRLLLLVLLATTAGCGTPIYTLVMAPKPDPVESRSTFSPALAASPPKRVLVVHPRWPRDLLPVRRGAIERGFMARGVQTRFADPEQGPQAFNDAASALARELQADAVLEITRYDEGAGLIGRYFVWAPQKRALDEVDRAAYAASVQPVRVEVTNVSRQLVARLVEAASGEPVASYRLSLPNVNHPHPDPYTMTFTLEEGAPREVKSNAGVLQGHPGDAREELLFETLGRELPVSQPRPAGTGAQETPEQWPAAPEGSDRPR